MGRRGRHTGAHSERPGAAGPPERTVTGSGAQWLAERIIGRACRRLPAEAGRERYREWLAELPAIRGDPDVRSGPVRTMRLIRYAAGTYRGSRRLAARTSGLAGPPARVAGGGWASRSRRNPLGRPALPDGAILVSSAVVLWVAVIVVIRTHAPVGYWNVVGVAGGFGSEVLAVVGIVRFVRWARRRSKRGRRS